MKIVVSITDLDEVKKAKRAGAEVIELRLDLASRELHTLPTMLKEEVPLPFIVTLRSKAEGGVFLGNAREWIDIIRKFLPITDYVDIERSYRNFAPEIKYRGKQVIASYHSDRMLNLSELIEIEKELRGYGDIPKIVPTPFTQDDIITLLAFTSQAVKPICTGIQGQQFRYGRILLALYGSEFVYCHMRNPTAEGQYHIKDFKSLFKQLLH